MAIICDICRLEIPIADLNEGEEFENFKTIDMNGELQLCGNCIISSGEFIRGKEMKAYALNFNKQDEMEE